MDNLDYLQSIWKFENNKFTSLKDSNCFVEKDNVVLDLSCFYRTHVLPLPFMGNVNNPDILVLALNPSYEPYADEIDTRDICENVGYESYIKKLFEVSFFSNNEMSMKIIGNNTYDWWKNKVFGNLNLNGKFEIGIFNLCGYHSRNYRTIPRKYLVSKSYLPTQIETRKIISNLINDDKVKLVIIIWGNKQWSKYLNCDLCNNKVVVLNEDNGYNCSILKYCKESKKSDKVKLLRNFFEIK